MKVHHRPRRRTTVALIAALGISSYGCTSSSIGSDLSRVRELTRVSQLPDVADHDIEPSTAQDVKDLLQRPLDADAAVRIALLNNRGLRATLREMGIARGQLLQAGVLPNPIVGAEIPPEADAKVELRIEYDLTRAVLAAQRSRAAEPLVAAARYRAAAAVIDLGYRVRIAFYAVQAAEQRLALAQQSLDALAASRDATRALQQAGGGTALDLASQEAAYERTRIDVALMELEVATARERVQRLFGTHGTDTVWQVRAPLAAVPEQAPVGQDVENVAVNASLELAEARERLQALARQAGVSQTEGWLPDVSISASGRLSEAQPGGGKDDAWQYGGGVNVGIPLFDRGQGKTAEQTAEFDALLERYYGMATDIRSAVREARARLFSAHARARQYEHTILPAQAQVTAQTLLQYNAMQLSVFQLIDARREELTVQLAYVETLRAYACAVAELDAALAGRRASDMARETSTTTTTADGAPGGH